MHSFNESLRYDVTSDNDHYRINNFCRNYCGTFYDRGGKVKVRIGEVMGTGAVLRRSVQKHETHTGEQSIASITVIITPTRIAITLWFDFC